MKRNIYILLLLPLLIFFNACSEEEFDVSPSSHLGSSIAIKNENDVRSAINAVYDQMTTSTYYNGKYLTAADMLGDDMLNPYFASGHLSSYFDYSWSKIACPKSFYSKVYYIIAHINNVLAKTESLEQTTSRDALIAELKCLRAIVHFDVARLYGPAPTSLGKGNIKADALAVPIMDEVKDLQDYEAMLRRTVKDVYAFVISELEANRDKLEKGKLNGFLGYDAATAALARIELYNGDYNKAYQYAKELIDNPDYSLIKRVDYVSSWAKEYTSEAIFELPALTDDNADINSIGYFCLAEGSSGYKEITASKHFEALMNADTNDERFKLFVFYKDNKGSGYLPTKKYPGRGGDSFVNNLKIFRLSEMYLTAAEAKFHLGQGSEAATLLNKLRAERTTTKPNKYTAKLTLEDVLYERRIELFAEGHRAWDLWRNQLPVVRWTTPEDKDVLLYRDAEYEGVIPFDSYKAILPIHESQLILLPENLRTGQQNPEY